ncbi:MAG: hypothetical protein ACE5PV_08035 [Candidatus Poribacteria bacterium]
MQIKTWLILLLTGFLILSFSQTSTSKLLFHDDFEKDKIGSEPSKWEMAHKGGGQKATVIKDPDDAKNHVMSSSSAPAGNARHDAGGSIYVTGDPNWTDYVAEWDMMFPEDYYMGVVFRFQNAEAFYLSDRRGGGVEYNFYKRKAGNWSLIAGGRFQNKPMVWYRARLILRGSDFTFKLKELEDETPFSKIDPATKGSDGDFKKGRFGNYGLVYLDNIFIGDSEDDLVLPVSPGDKLSSTWGKIKKSY